jgi:7-carboxy-7-deazaguanine synthase
VLPAEVRRAERLETNDIVERVASLGGPARWVVLSGGNPVLRELSDLVDQLHDNGMCVAVETQASRWKPWLERIDRLCLSPKGPSSGMCERGRVHETLARVRELSHERPPGWAFIKVVVFDDSDYMFARELHLRSPELPFFLSAGNDAGRTVGSPDRIDSRGLADIRADLLESSLRLVSRVLADDAMSDVRVQSQYHVLLWGNKQGV